MHMSLQLILGSLLVLHLAGITLMAGLTLFHFFTLNGLNKYLLTDNVRSLSIIEEFNRLSPWIGIGGMVLELKQAVTLAIWFRVKMPLVAIMIINGAWLSKLLSHRIHRELKSRVEHSRATHSSADSSSNKSAQALNRLRVIYTIQVLLILVIFTLSIFKFQ
jgi:hypothetical protein